MSSEYYIVHIIVKDKRVNSVNYCYKIIFYTFIANITTRHTLRDCLRAVECLSDMIDQIGGWKSIGGIGSGYGQGYSADHLKKYIERINLI